VQCVVAIVDHHEDRGRHLQVDGPDREIAFCSGEGLGRATVASTCTLCAERVCPSKTYMIETVFGEKSNQDSEAYGDRSG
jgi:hypothetical protein